MRRLPPLVELRAFEAAARSLSFKQAAAELNVTPTAISHQIKLLETYCGQPLFRRRPRPLALTWAGEQLFPILRDGFDKFSEAMSMVQAGGASGRLRITATNAFCARWLLPRLHDWQRAYPRLKLTVVGTDRVLDLSAGETDIAIRYAAKAPRDGKAIQLVRDRFLVVASPRLVGRSGKMLNPIQIARLPLIEAEWPSSDTKAPTWRRWQRVAQAKYKNVPDLAAMVSITFREELHAIEAAIAGHGIAICSDILIADELASGLLVPISRSTLSGYGFYITYRDDHAKIASLRAFIDWAQFAR